jgi:hypothetical protein
MSSRANVAKRGSTWTYYVYVTGGDGRRQQVSKGGFRTRKEAEAARVRALGTLQNGTWVRPERVTVRKSSRTSGCRRRRRRRWKRAPTAPTVATSDSTSYRTSVASRSNS